MALRRPDKYESLHVSTKLVFDQGGGNYGYRRVHAVLKKDGTIASEKVIRRIMKESGMKAHVAGAKRKYSSYVGEISPEVANVINRDLHADSQTRNG